MAFTQVALTGTVTLSNNTPAGGATVSLTLGTPITDGTELVIPEPLVARCQPDGTFSLTVNANDDPTTLPLGSDYVVEVGYKEMALSTFNVIVPHADAPSVDLFTLATLPNPSVVNPYVSQLVAGSGITLSPVGGTGAVTVSSSAGAAPVYPTEVFRLCQLMAFDPVATVGTWHPFANSASFIGGGVENTSAAVGDSITTDILLAAGTWDCTIIYCKYASGGQFQASLDGTNFGSVVDSYSSTTAYNTGVTTTGISVPTTGNHALALTVVGKSSGTYECIIEAVQLRKIA